MLTAIWSYRYFIVAAIVGELRGRFARSKLGLAWSILNPLAQALIFTLVLAEFLRVKIKGADDRAAYAVYLMAGIAAWGLFSEIVNRSLSIFIEYSSALKKIAFPRICLPIIVLGTAMLNHILLLFAMAVVFAWFGRFPGLSWLALVPAMVLISIFAFGLGLLLGIFNVFARDVSQVTAVILQIWFWLTPIVYTADIVPTHLQWLLSINPIAPLVTIYQDALLLGRWPDIGPLLIPTGLSLALAALTVTIFRRASADLVDAL